MGDAGKTKRKYLQREMAMSDENGGDWVSVSEVATARGISERAIQKQCKAGKLRAQLVSTESGAQWQIAADEIAPASTCSARTPEPNEPTNARTDEPTNEPNEPTFERARTKSGEPTNQKVPELANLTNELANQSREPNEPNARTNQRTGEPDLMAHLIDENRFLRNAIEQHQRSEAELRNALRTALAAMPKALNEGTPQVLAGPENQNQTMPQVLAEDVNAAPEPGQFRGQNDGVPKVTADKKGARNIADVARGRGFRGWLLGKLRG